MAVQLDIDISDLLNGQISTDANDGTKEWQGDGVFDRFIMAINDNLKIQYLENRLKAEDYGKAYSGLVQNAMNLAIDYMFRKPEIERKIELMESQLLTEQKQQLILDQDLLLKIAQTAMITQQKLSEVENTANLVKQGLILTEDKNIKHYENTVLQVDQHEIALKQIDKSVKEATMLSNQNLMIVAQTAEIQPNAAKQRAVQDGQIGQMLSEVNYTNAKKIVMEESRIDNLALEALKAQMTNLATVGAGGLTPSTTDFVAANSLRAAIYDRARGNALPAVSFTAGTAYVKAT